MKRQRLDDAPRAQRLVALCRVLDALVDMAALPPLDCPEGQHYDLGGWANWSCGVALGLGLQDVVRACDAVTDDWFTAGKRPTKSAEDVRELLLVARDAARAAAAAEMKRCA